MAIANGDLLDMPQAMTIPQNVCIQGTLIINLSDYHFFTSFLNMALDASILIPSGNTLVIDNSNLYGCADMWEGITVNGGIPSGRLDIISSTITDAETAVLIRTTAQLIAQDNIFENNRLGIHAEGVFFFGSASQPMPLTGNTFRTNGSLLSGGLGFAGIELTQQKGFTVGSTNGAASPNVFDNLENGIVAHRSNFGVHGATFRNMPDVGSSIPAATIGYGIFAETRSFAKVSNCSFETLSTAIHADNSSLDVYNNAINTTASIGVAVGTGVRTIGSNSFTKIDVHDNTISSLRFGMLFIEMGDASTFEVVDNTINIGDTAIDPVFSGFSGIHIDNSSFTSTNKGLINENTINMFAARDGININASSWVDVRNNDIFISPAGGTGVLNGINTTSSVDLSITYNSVLTTNQNPPRGMIAVGTANSGFCCNTFNGTSTSVQFAGTCSDASFKGNTFGTSNIGLLYEQHTTTGPQKLAGNLWSGSYTDVGAKHLSTNPLFISGSTYRVNPTITFTWPPSVNPQTGWFKQTFLSDTYTCQSNSTCKTPPAFSEDTLSSDHQIAMGIWDSGLAYQSTLTWEGQRNLFDKLDKNPDLMQGEPLLQNFYNSMLGTTVELFTDIQDDIAALADTSPSEMLAYQSNQADLVVFLHDLAMLDSQLFDATEPLISSLQNQRDIVLDKMAALEATNDSLLVIIHNARLPLIQQIIANNNAITTTAVFEQNEKEVNDIWLNTMAQGLYSFTPVQTTSLEGIIIYQCPKYGSHAVQKARGLYSLVTIQEYDDDLLCIPPQQLQNNSEMQVNGYPSMFNLYPNPANKEINLLLEEMPEGKTTVQITDVSGKTVKEQQLPTGQSIHTISLDGLAKGTYFCKVFHNKKQVSIQTHVIAQ